MTYDEYTQIYIQVTYFLYYLTPEAFILNFIQWSQRLFEGGFSYSGTPI